MALVAKIWGFVPGSDDRNGGKADVRPKVFRRQLRAHRGHPAALAGTSEADIRPRAAISGDEPIAVHDVSNGNKTAEMDRVLLKMMKLDIPGLAATAGG